MSSLVRSLTVPKEKGVPHRQLWELTHWDKRFNGVANHKQVEIRKYSYMLASELKALASTNGSIKLLNTGADDFGATTPELAGDNVANGEIVCVPWGGTPSVQYHSGDFVTSDNRIAVSRDTGVIRTRFLYYALQAQMPAIAKSYRGSGIKHPDMNQLLNLTVPVPPIETQDEIISFLGHFEDLDAALNSELEARKRQFEFIRMTLLADVSASEILKPLGELADLNWGNTSITKASYVMEGEKFLAFSASGADGFLPTYDFNRDGIVLSAIGALAGKTWRAKGKWSCIKNTIRFFSKDESLVTNDYLYWWTSTPDFWPRRGAAQPFIAKGDAEKLIVPVPTIEIQNKVSSVLNQLNDLVGSMEFGLPAEIAARRKQYEYYRDQLLNFKEA